MSILGGIKPRYACTLQGLLSSPVDRREERGVKFLIRIVSMLGA